MAGVGEAGTSTVSPVPGEVSAPWHDAVGAEVKMVLASTPPYSASSAAKAAQESNAMTTAKRGERREAKSKRRSSGDAAPGRPRMHKCITQQQRPNHSWQVWRITEKDTAFRNETSAHGLARRDVKSLENANTQYKTKKIHQRRPQTDCIESRRFKLGNIFSQKKNGL